MFFVEKCQSLDPTHLLLRLGWFSTFPNCIKSGLDFSVGRKSTTIRSRLPIRLGASTAALNVIAIISKIARSRSTCKFFYSPFCQRRRICRGKGEDKRQWKTAEYDAVVTVTLLLWQSRIGAGAPDTA